MTKIYIDEAGRGPLAGPLHVGLVVLLQKLSPSVYQKLNIKDSKKLSEKQREQVFPEIQKLVHHKKICYTVSVVTHEEIDLRGMTKSLNQAIKRGLDQLWITPQSGDELLIDGNRDFGLSKDLDCKITTIIDGDDLIAEISLASIVAKVTRDHEMIKLHEQYPQYNFAKHKGYGTLEHRNLIALHGPSAIHRKSFLKELFPEYRKLKTPKLPKTKKSPSKKSKNAKHQGERLL